MPGADLPHVRTGDDLRSMLAGGGGPVPGVGGATGLAIRAATRLGVTRDPARVRRLSQRWLPLGHEVVVIGGGLVGLELAEFLAERGRRVTVLESGPVLGLPMALPRRWEAVARAAGHGVDLHRSAELVEITPGSVRFRTAADDGRPHDREVPATDVVVASEVGPGAPLAEALDAAGFDVRVVGDAATVGYIEGAMHSAGTVARAL